MKTNLIDVTTFLNMLNGGYQNLAQHCREINYLNVFPVPDGDTGSNMKVTIGRGLKAVEEKNSVSILMQELAHGMLFSARGNSGVLLSQYFRGIALGLDGLEEVSVMDFASSLVRGYEVAYEAAVAPVEGTILTVAREGIENALPLINEDTSLLDMVSTVSKKMRASLDNTPNLLPVLKEAGVIDSGGKGLLSIFEGFEMALRGEDIATAKIEEDEPKPIDCSFFDENSSLEYGYCTEFLLQLLKAKAPVESFDIDSFIEFLQSHGDSVVCFQNGTIVKVHIHTKKPYKVMEFAQRYGEFVTFKMDNMSLQHNEVVSLRESQEKKRKKVGFIAFAKGEGTTKIFKELGCDVVLDGGDDMSIAVSEILSAINKTNADDIFLLPNDNNLALTVNQVSLLCNTCNIHLVQTRSVQEGYFALSSVLMTEENLALLEEGLNKGKDLVYTANIKKSKDMHGFSANLNWNQVAFSTSRIEAFLSLLKAIPEMEEKEFMFVFCGKDVGEEEKEELRSKVEESYPFLELGLFSGGQNGPDYMVGVEA
ncbi:MAG: DAK2 domain-containing protein [Bacilli bacterium]|nr:DAK2 domain-containing protein [Bacilli bacterium]